ncbi:MAG: TetR/AcrR family transcriptional regulator [Microcoleaceae cyanobacterium]
MGTKEQIIDAAERLFAESGFAGTSLRAVTREAEVNLAAVHYHFGSKEALFRAVVRQIAEPIVQQQVQRLDSLKELDSPPPVEKLIEAFVAPQLYIAQERR